MALSASSPCIKGYLLDTDTRWENISMMCDDRTEEELGLKVISLDSLFFQCEANLHHKNVI